MDATQDAGNAAPNALVVDEDSYKEVVFTTQREYVEHFASSALEGHNFFMQINGDPPLNRDKKKQLLRDFKKAAKEAYTRERKDDKGRVVLKLPKALHMESPSLTATDTLAVYFFARKEVGYTRCLLNEGEFSPAAVAAYMGHVRWVVKIATLDKMTVRCLFCQTEASQENPVILHHVSHREEEKCVESKIWLSCQHEGCQKKLPVWLGEKKMIDERGLQGDQKEYDYVEWGKKHVDVVLPALHLRLEHGKLIE